jgi:hypothetical protein
VILVADASALIALAACESLDLLDVLFGQVVVPDAVFVEVTVSDKPYSSQLRTYLNHKVRSVDMQYFVYLDAYSDLGETQAMLLYKSISADYLLIDDKRGRKVARLNHIQTIGTMGVLLQAKRRGLIAKVAPLIEKIRASPVFLSEDLVHTVLQIADEI